MSLSNHSQKFIKFGGTYLIAFLTLAAVFTFQSAAVHADDSDTATTTDSVIVTDDATSTAPIITTPSDPTTDVSSTASSTEDTSDATTTDDSDASSTPPITNFFQTLFTLTQATTTGTAHILVRDGATIAWSGDVTFPIGTSTTDVLPTEMTHPDSTSTPIAVRDQSLLGVLENLQQTESAFSLSNLEYYSSFSEFLIDCITVPSASSDPACYNWQYQIDGVYPYQSIDQYLLQDGDTVNLYFGSPNQVEVSSSTVTTTESFVATAETYDAATNTYVPTPGVTLAVTQPDPNNPWSPTEIATSTADQNGQATFTIATPGSYGVGTEESFFFPLAPVTVAVATSTNTHTNSGGSGSGSSGGSTSPTSSSVNTSSAFTYLVSNQNSDGSFASPIITDWSALTFALSDAPQAARTKLATYLQNNQPSLSAITDYERHAMALMALGINPYNGTSVDDITPIVQAFDGTKIGDPSLINNDVFGLIVLPHVGYTTSDAIIQKTTAFLISQQAGNGSWVGSPDLTGAAIQALSSLTSLPGVSASIAKAETYLHSQEQSDGSFGNSFSTSWVLGGINARGEAMTQWTIGTSTPATSLAGLQQTDGGIDPTSESADNRTWATAYALTAAEGRSWSSLLSSFAKPTGSTTITGGSTSSATTTTATTTPSIATSTPVTIPVVPVTPTVSPVIPTNTTHVTPFVRTTTTPSPTSSITTGTSIAETNNSSSNSLASADASPAAHSFWNMIANIFSSFFSFLSHLF